MVTVQKLIDGLRSIDELKFDCDNVYGYLSENPVDVDSITPYFFWNKDYYTRNLIYKDDRFELMAICWERGQTSQIHNHADQKCWMTVPVGKLQGQNFSVVEMDQSRGFCKLTETDSFCLSDCLAAKVELEQPIHQIRNLPEYDQRAVSLHIYSKPYDRCLSYDLESDTFKEVPLYYTSISGTLLEDFV